MPEAFARSNAFVAARLDQSDGAFLYCAMFPTSLPRLSLFFLSVMLMFVQLGCGKKVVQYPEDHERFVKIDRAVDALRKAYVAKDHSKLEDIMLPLDQLEQLRREAEGDFEAFRDIMLEFAVERIMIDGEDIDVFVHWHGIWRRDAEDPGFRQRGHMRLQWVGTQSILLRGVQGDAPFGMKARQPISEPVPTAPR